MAIWTGKKNRRNYEYEVNAKKRIVGIEIAVFGWIFPSVLLQSRIFQVNMKSEPHKMEF